MIFIWKGRGILTILIVIVTFLIGIFTLPNEYAKHGFTLPLIISGLFSIIFGNKWNDSPKSYIDKKTEETVTLKNQHTIFWINMEYWGILLLTLGIAILSKKIGLTLLTGLTVLILFKIYKYKKKKQKPVITLQNEENSTNVIEDKTQKNKFKKFLKSYKPSRNCIKITPELLEEYKNKVPKSLLNLWKNQGLGKYNKGLIEIVNPKDFEDTLWTFLGKKVENYVPIAITAFGELFYYRKLTETEEDVCLVDIQYRNIETVAWSLDLFFEDFLLDDEMKEEWLREKLFKKAMLQEKPLIKNEIFTFAPALALGGSAELKYIKRGNAQVYQDLVFQITK